MSSVVEVRYFDGRSSRPHTARIHVLAGRLVVAPTPDESFETVSVPLVQVRWPERTRHGGRLVQLPDGASLQALDVTAWDDWAAQFGPHESWVTRMQQNWRGVVLALVLLLAAGTAVYRWGLPLIARGVTAAIPQQVDRLVGTQALQSIDASLMAPSTLSAAQQAHIREGFARMVQAAYPEGVPAWRLEFRSARDKRLGPNAFALPGGSIVLTDEMVRLLPGDDAAVLGVLGHEFGHVRLRHGMRQLVQAAGIGFAASVAFGDYGSLISSAPVLLATMGYSREAEREADAESVRLMRAAGQSPAAMVRFFEAVERWRAARRGAGGNAPGDESVLGMAFSSHPASAERIAFFRDAAQD